MQTQIPSPPSAAAILRAAKEFSFSLSEEQVFKIQQYMAILLQWNEKINLTAIRDPIEILYRHFCESMFAVTKFSFGESRLADVGSGAGFPGIPLKIICPELQLFLIESNLKKATFMAEVIRELGLTDTQVLVRRYEELGEELAPLDFVCSKALGEFSDFLKWAGSAPLAAENVLLWIGARDLEEIQKLPGWKWQEPISIPHSLRRMILLGQKSVASVGLST
jgi:16S rRNA (guanine527-N7)-methyltransferase